MKNVHLYESDCDPNYYFWCGDDYGDATRTVEDVTCVDCLLAFARYADKALTRLAQLEKKP